MTGSGETEHLTPEFSRAADEARLSETLKRRRLLRIVRWHMEPTRINKAVTKSRIDAESLREQNNARRMRGQPVLHECSICGHCAEWNDSWTWYGSVMDQDAGKVAKFCSAECMHTESPDKTLRRVRRAS